MTSKFRRPAVKALQGIAVLLAVSIQSVANVCPSVTLSSFSGVGGQYDPVAWGQYIYKIGGWNTELGSLNEVWIGHIRANGSVDWLPSYALPVADQGPSATIYNNWLYVVLTTGRVYRAHILPNGSLEPWIGPVVGMPFRGGFKSAEAYNGFLYVMGGFGGNGGCSMYADVIVARIQADGSLGPWQSTTSMPEPRQHQSVHFFGNRAYIACGIGGCVGPILDTVWSAPVDPGTGMLGPWRQEASLPIPLWYHASALIGNQIVVGGGRTTYYGGPGGQSIDIYRGTINPVDGTISEWVREQCTMAADQVTGVGVVYVDSLGVTFFLGGFDADENPTSAVRRSKLTVRGDMNCDGVVDNFDIDAFVVAVTQASLYSALYPDCDRMLADTNGDGFVDNFDIDPFVRCLTSGGCAPTLIDTVSLPTDGTVATSSAILQPGKTYTLVANGTIMYWPEGGFALADIEFIQREDDLWYDEHVDTSLRFLVDGADLEWWGTSDGATLSRGVYSATHEYRVFTFQGRGQHVTFQISSGNPTDDTGVITVSIYSR